MEVIIDSQSVHISTFSFRTKCIDSVTLIEQFYIPDFTISPFTSEPSRNNIDKHTAKIYFILVVFGVM